MSIQTLSIAATGMKAQQTNVDVIANNIANVNTNGFKKQRAEFTDLFYQSLRKAGAPATDSTRFPTGIELGTGVRLVATKRLHTQGTALETEKPLDLMIEGKGLFQIQLPDGTIAYTRNGSFNADSEGRIVTSDGLLLEPEVSVGTDILDIEVSKEGEVTVTLNNNSTPSTVGQIQIVTFVNPSGLEALGGTLFKETAASGTPVIGNPGLDGRGTIRRGFLEGSNVNVVKELVELISAQRAFELNSSSIQAADEMLQVANNLRR